MTIDITTILTTVLTAAGVVISVFLIPFIRTKFSATQFSFLENAVKVAVYAAEVFIVGSGKGKEKLKYVLEYMKDFCEKHNITFNTNEIEQMIEKAWIELTGGKSSSNQ